MEILTVTLDRSIESFCTPITLTNLKPNRFYELKFFIADGLYCPGVIQRSDSEGKVTFRFYRTKNVSGSQRIKLEIHELTEFIVSNIECDYIVKLVNEVPTVGFSFKIIADMKLANIGEIVSDQLAFNFENEEDVCIIRGAFSGRDFNYFTFQLYCVNERLKSKQGFCKGEKLKFSLSLISKPKKEPQNLPGAKIIQLPNTDGFSFSGFEPNCYYAVSATSVQLCRKWCKSDENGRILVPYFNKTPEIQRLFSFYKLEEEPPLVSETLVSIDKEYLASGTSMELQVSYGLPISIIHPEDSFVEKLVSIELTPIAFREGIYYYAITINFNEPAIIPNQNIKILAYFTPRMMEP